MGGFRASQTSGLKWGRASEAGQTASRLLELFLRTGETELALGLIREAPGRTGEPLPPRFYLPAAREAFARARAHPACTDALRPAVDRALAELERGGVRTGETAGPGRSPRRG